MHLLANITPGQSQHFSLGYLAQFSNTQVKNGLWPLEEEVFWGCLGREEKSRQTGQVMVYEVAD